MKKPDFLIIGASRSGTTTLYHQLREHPDICMPAKKEIRFFDKNWSKGIDWYTKQFKDCEEDQIKGEASTSYTWPQSNDIPARIKETIPAVKLIYLIRNPVERTYSHYYYNKYRGNEDRSFLEAVKENSDYLGISKYLDFIKSYLEYFREQQFLIMIAEEFFTNPYQEISRCYSFLDVDRTYIPKSINIKTNRSFDSGNVKIINFLKSIYGEIKYPIDRLLPEKMKASIRELIHRSTSGGERPLMSEEVKMYLESKYNISALENVLGRDLDLWKN